MPMPCWQALAFINWMFVTSGQGRAWVVTRLKENIFVNTPFDLCSHWNSLCFFSRSFFRFLASFFGQRAPCACWPESYEHLRVVNGWMNQSCMDPFLFLKDPFFWPLGSYLANFPLGFPDNPTGSYQVASKINRGLTLNTLDKKYLETWISRLLLYASSVFPIRFLDFLRSLLDFPR